MIKVLADRIAEAATEYLHEKVRKEFWGYASHESFNNEELIRENTAAFDLLQAIPLVLIILKANYIKLKTRKKILVSL